MRRTRLVLSALTLGLLLSLPIYHALAQSAPNQINPANATGTQPYNTYGGARENINLSNGNLSLQIPLLTLPGRNGHDLVLGLQYDSKIWVVQHEFDPYTGVRHWWEFESRVPGLEYGGFSGASKGFGWRVNIPVLQSNWRAIDVEGGEPHCHTDFIVSLGNSSKHSFDNRAICHNVTETGETPDPTQNRTLGDSQDAAFLRLDTADESDVVLHMKDGTRIHFLTNFPLGPEDVSYTKVADKIVDPNGNVVTIESGTYQQGTASQINKITDTVGREVVFNWVSSRLDTISYKDSSGASQTITLQYTNLNIAPTFAKPISTPDPSPTTRDLLTTILLPNSLTFAFQYNNFGELTKITYPTGGYTKYDYGAETHWYYLWASAGSTAADFRELTARHVCREADGTCGTEDDTFYTATVDGTKTNNEYMEVLDAEGNKTLHQFSFEPSTTVKKYFSPRELERWVYQGTTTLLRTIEMDYDPLDANGRPENYALPIRTTTTLNDTSPALVSKVEWDYDTYTSYLNGSPTTLPIDNATEKREYEYGLTLVRKTVNTWLKGSYHSTAIHILDRKTSEKVYTGAGSLVAQTDFEYDNYTAGLTFSGAVQHDSSFGTGYTTRGNLTATKRWRNTDGAWLPTRNQYDDAGNIVETKDPLGHPTSFSYADSWGNAACDPVGGDAVAYLTSATNALGHVTTSKYNSCSGTAAETTDPNTQTTSFGYDVMGRLIQTNLPDGGQTTRTFDEATGPPLSVTTTTKITSTTDKVDTVVIDGLGRAVETRLESDPEGVVNAKTTYDILGRRETVTNPYRSTSDPTYGITTFEYDALSRVKKVIPPDGTAGSNNVTPTYSGNVTTVTDQQGKQRRSFTDALGRLIQVDEPGDATAATYATGSATVSGSLNSSTSSGTPGTGSVTISGNLNSTWIDPCSDQGMFPPCPEEVYDSGSVWITVNGVTKTVSYGVSGNNDSSKVATALRNAISGDGSYPVTASGTGTTITLTARQNGANTNYSLSAGSSTSQPWYFSSPSFTATPSGSTLTGGTDGATTYDSGTVTVTVGGFPATANFGQGSTATSVATDLTSILNGASSPVTASQSGTTINMTAKTAGATGNYSVSTSWTWNQSLFPGDPSFTASGSDLTGGADAASGSLANPYVTTYQYDVLDNLTYVDQGDRDRSFVYNSLSQLTSATNPESGTITYTYDNDGNVTTNTDARNITITYNYDTLHRLTGKTYTDATPAVSYFYDQTSYNGLSITNGKGRRTGMSDGAGAQASSYDELGREVADRRTTTNSVTKTFSYTYNLGGLLATLTYPSGNVITNSYNAAGRSLSAVDTANTTNYATEAHYSPAGALCSLKNGASIVSTFRFNTRLQPDRIHVTTTGAPASPCDAPAQTANILDFTYDFDQDVANNGNVKQITNNLNNDRTQSFTYDQLNRIKTVLTQADAGQYCWGLDYNYDRYGNMHTRTVSKCTAVPLSAAEPVNNKNQLEDAADPNYYDYDAAGNLTKQGTQTYTYDAENRMTAVAGVNYDYDADGRRVKKSNGTLYWYGVGGNVLLETDSVGNSPKEFVFFGGRRVARRDSSGSVYYFFSDHLGSARIMTDSAGAIVEDSDFYPFGGEREVVSNLDNNYKFTGQERDTESGLDYFGARHHASNLGRFIQPDAPFADQHVTNPQSWNLYAYARNNPLRFTDPTGQSARVRGGPMGAAGLLSALTWGGHGWIQSASASSVGVEYTYTYDDEGQIVAVTVVPESGPAVIVRVEAVAKVLYNESAAARATNSEGAGSAQDLHNARVAMGEVAFRLLALGKADHVAPSKLTPRAQRDVRSNPVARAAYQDSLAAAREAASTFSITRTSTHFIHTREGTSRTGPHRPAWARGTPFRKFGPFYNSARGHLEPGVNFYVDIYP